MSTRPHCSVGESSSVSADLTKPYEPYAVEQRWYAFWEQHGVFDASDSISDSRPVYVVPMPPPNVTGSLHMGHALFCTLQDALIRYHRMSGYNALWQPGIDHAGIATQLVVERQLLQEGTNRHALGRAEFEKRVWQWKAQSGGRIQEQQRVIGSSADWKRSKFTMDPDMGRAVTEAFVRLYEAGLVYRDTRLINWCPECRTALSDLEVENEEGAQGELFSFAYQVEGGGELVVATTRPETMLGDTAVAVHPDDPRYKAFHGKKLVHPFTGRLIPVITDPILVNPKFGTGAVKVTPSHDSNDFAAGKRNNLEFITIFELDGKINAQGGLFAGLDRKKARTAVKQALEEKGLSRGAKPHMLTLPRCQRSGGVVEPMISTQWFVRMSGMAQAALHAVLRGETQILPSEWTKTYEHFLENIQDWCISRQLWWGHRIPAWYGPNGELRVARERPPECGKDWVQDEDVLDTWFSSALWPFSTLGWPEQTPALAKFYPASDLETGYDILFFWVARMMMFGMHFMGKAPFKRILLHGLVVDEIGEKMSKVKGNVIDPLDLIQGAGFSDMVKKSLPGAPENEALAKFKKAYPSVAQMGTGFPAFGADALRFTLATFAPTNKRIALAPKRLEGYRHFINKLWNAARFSLEQLKEWAPAQSNFATPQALFNRWILARLNHAISVAQQGFEAFRIDETAGELYRFFWNDVCDWYLELTKTVFGSSSSPHALFAEETRQTLHHVLETTLRLLHPLIPFVTEDLWQRLPKLEGSPVSLALASYPTENDGRMDKEAVQAMEILQAVITAARTLRSEYEVPPSSQVALELRMPSESLAWLTEYEYTVRSLVKTAGEVRFAKTGEAQPAASAMSVVPTEKGTIEVFVGLKGLVTASKERERVSREQKRIDKDLTALEKKLNAPGFVDRAPPDVVREAEAQRTALREARKRLDDALALAAELEV